MAMAAKPQGPPVKYAVALFNGFQLLDVAGPLDVLSVLAQQVPIEVYVLAATLDPVTSRTARPGTVGQEIVPTHTFSTAPEDIEVLLVPGGGGTRDTEATQPLVDYVRQTFPALRYFLTVCTGTALAARSGVLDGKSVTTNKLSFDWVRIPVIKTLLNYINMQRSKKSHCADAGVFVAGRLSGSQGQLDPPRALGDGWQYLDIIGDLGRY